MSTEVMELDYRQLSGGTHVMSTEVIELDYRQLSDRGHMF